MATAGRVSKRGCLYLQSPRLSDVLSNPISDLASNMASDPATVNDPSASSEGGSRGLDSALVLAWLVSVGVHIILFGTMVAIPWITESMGRDDSLDLTATEIRPAADETKFTMVPNKPARLTPPVEQRADEQVVPKRKSSLDQLTEPTRDKLAVVGIGTGGGEFTKYGLRAGPGGSGPQFFGLGGEARAARSIVYVVDRSGSMIDVFDDLRAELKRSIDRLRKSQKYHVIFYSTDPPLESPPARLVNAIRATKEVTFEFIDQVMPEGMTQPIEAMRRAFLLEPDLIYFLSDGDIPTADQLKEELRLWNKEEKVRIFTIAYVSTAGRQLLEEIAREHNGEFKFVSEYDLRD